MTKSKKRIVGGGALALSMIVGLWIGCSPLMQAGPEVPVMPAPKPIPENNFNLSSAFPEGSNAGTLSVSLGEIWPQERSAAGLSGSDIKAGKGVLRNIYQIVMVNADEPGKIWDFDESKTAPFTLKVGIIKGDTYHILLLTGHDSGSGAPTLLASGYVKQTMKAGMNSITLDMTPLVVGVEFDDQWRGIVRQPGRLAKKVGLEPSTSYILRYTIGDASTAAPWDDPLRVVSGNGLKPLQDAEKNISSGLENWRGLNVVSNAWLDAMPLTHLNPDQEGPVYEYGLQSSAAVPAGSMVYFNLDYAPFGMAGTIAKDAPWEAWKKFSSYNGGATFTPPAWVIRNGWNDAVQGVNVSGDGASWNFQSSTSTPATYNKDDGRGGIPIGVL